MSQSKQQIQSQNQNNLNNSMQQIDEKFKQALKKIDHSNQLKSRIQGVKDLEQIFSKRIQKNPRHYQQQQQLNIQSTLEFPYCLSTVILKIQDLINNKDVKKECKFEIDNLIFMCFQLQKCLIYKIPFFMLNFIENNLDLKDKLKLLKFLTNDGREIDGIINSKLFYLLIGMLDPQLKIHCVETLAFIKNIFDYNPKCFTEITMIAIQGLNSGNIDHSNEVLETLQYLLKYNDHSSKLMNISLITLCVLPTKDHTQAAWFLLRSLIIKNPNYILQEIIEILHMGNLQIALHNESVQQILPSPKSQQISTIKQSNQEQSSKYLIKLNKEISRKCFQGNNSQLLTELDDITQSNQKDYSYQQKFYSIFELICINQCQHTFLDIQQMNQIYLLEQIQQEIFNSQKMLKFTRILDNDRTMIVQKFETYLDKIKGRAIYFISMALWETDLQCNSISINQILKIFLDLIRTYHDKYRIQYEVLMATQILVRLKSNDLFTEWDTIMDILNTLSLVQNKFQEKKLLDPFYEIFKSVKNLIIMESYPGNEQKALKTFNLFKIGNTLNEKTLSCLYINYMLNNNFLDTFQQIIEAYLLNEKNNEVRLLFLEKLQDFYEESEDFHTNNLIEQVFSKNLEQFFAFGMIQTQNQPFTSTQLIQLIDLFTFMAHKSQKSTNFKHIITILSETINYCDLEKTATDIPQNAYSVKQMIKNSGGMPFDLIKMKSFQMHALNRLIQLFVLKSQSIEYEKAVYIYNQLLNLLKYSLNDRRSIICEELLDKIKVNNFKELCWESSEKPLFIDFCQWQKFIQNEPKQEEKELGSKKSSLDSSRKSSGDGLGLGSYYQLRDFNSKMANKLQKRKLLEEQFSIFNTLKSLGSCIEDSTSTSDLRKYCVRIFNKFVIYITELDFMFSSDDWNNNQIYHTNLNEWKKVVNLLINAYQPLVDANLAKLLVETFYLLMGLQNYQAVTRFLTKSQHQNILGILIKTVEITMDVLHFGQLDKENSYDSLQKKNDNFKTKAQDPRQSNAGLLHKQNKSQSFIQVDTQNFVVEDIDEKKRKFIILCKSALSILGYSFLQDTNESENIWFESESDYKHQNIEIKEQRLIDYLINSLILIVLHENTMLLFGHHVCICSQNIIKALQKYEIMKQEPLLFDSLIFIGIRIAFPFLFKKLNLDSFQRKNFAKTVFHRTLKSLINDYSILEPIDEEIKRIINLIKQNGIYNSFNVHLILCNITELFCLKPSEDYQIPIYQVLNIANQVVQNFQSLLGGVLDIFIKSLSGSISWYSHSVYDRECHLRIDDQEEIQPHYFIWNRNIITMINKKIGTEIIVRNPSFNFRSIVKVLNKNQSNGYYDSNQTYNSLRSLIKKELKDIQEEENIEQFYQKFINDTTLLSLINPSYIYNSKIGQDLIYFDNKNEQFLNQLQQFDKLSTKDIYKFGLIYIPTRFSSLPFTQLGELINSEIDKENISDNFLEFFSYLGELSFTQKYEEYFDATKYDISIIANEDNISFVSYFSNVLIDSDIRENLLSKNYGNVCIIFNESGIEDFVQFDANKIFIIVSKLSKEAYKVEIQHNRSYFNNPSAIDLNVYARHSSLAPSKYEQQKQRSLINFNLQESPRDDNNLSQFSQYKDSKFHNGHLSDIAIVQNQNIGIFIKSLSMFSDIFERRQRFGHDYISSNMIQRCQKIQEIKKSIGKFGKPITIIK